VSSRLCGIITLAMEQIRTFIAVLISPELKSRIGEVEENFKKLPCDVKWVAEENLHITLKFLGNVSENKLEAVCSAVQKTAAAIPSGFELAMSGVGAFPNIGRPQVIWVGVHKGGEEMAKLAELLDDALSGLGFEKEKKRFSAHVTIGRARSPRGLDSLAEAIRTMQAEDLGSETIESIAVMKSELRPSGPVYSVVGEFKLGAS